jgi:hypothetical protein
MKIDKVWITDQGKIRGEHPDYPFPDAVRQSSFDSREWEQLWKEYETALQLAKDHSIEFDLEKDREVIRILIRTETNIWENSIKPGIYTVDLPEVEMVEQYRGKLSIERPDDYGWVDGRVHDKVKKKYPDGFEYRTVFRFVERKEEKPKQTNNMNEIPRRIRIDLFTPAELAIYNAQQEVEKAGADVRLTKASILLSQAREAVADFVDDKKLYTTIEEMANKPEVERKEEYCDGTFYCSLDSANIDGICAQCGKPKMKVTPSESQEELLIAFNNGMMNYLLWKSVPYIPQTALGYLI